MCWPGGDDARSIGADIPVWDPQLNFGDTDLLVSDMQQGRDTFLTPGEIDKIRARQNKGRPGEGFDRAWQYWLRHAGFPTE